MSSSLAVRYRHWELPLFAILAFVLTWGSWIWSSLAEVGRTTFPLPETVAERFGAWGPSLAGLLITTAYRGRIGARTLWHRLVTWRASPRWYLAAVFLPVIMSLLTSRVSVVLGMESPTSPNGPSRSSVSCRWN